MYPPWEWKGEGISCICPDRHAQAWLLSRRRNCRVCLRRYTHNPRSYIHGVRATGFNKDTGVVDTHLSPRVQGTRIAPNRLLRPTVRPTVKDQGYCACGVTSRIGFAFCCRLWFRHHICWDNSMDLKIGDRNGRSSSPI
jgi:hypothetical protein